MLIDFGEWTPDLPALLNGSLFTATNCISSGQGYMSMAYPSVYSSAINSRCIGAISVKDTTQATTNFCGSATKLYKLSGATWNDVSVAANYTAGSTERWFFAQFGNQILTTQINDPIQTYTLNSSALFANLITGGSAPAGEKPKARYICTLRDFVVIANTNDGLDGNRPSRVRWSPIGVPAGDVTNGWAVNPVTQCDYQDLDGIYGAIRQIVGGEYGVIFQERAIWRMSYVGSPLVFQFDLVDKKNGTLAPSSVIPIGPMTAYLGLDGFYVFDGNYSHNIGENKVNQFFFKDFDEKYYDRVIGFIIPNSQLVGWAYPGVGNLNGTPNKLIIYNYAQNATKKWTLINAVNSDHIYLGLSTDQLIINISALISGSTISNIPLNSNYFKGGITNLSTFDVDFKQYIFPGIETAGGNQMTARLETHDYQLTPSKLTDLSLIRPVVTGNPTMTLELGQRNNLTDAVTTVPYPVNDTGEFPVRSNARYHRFGMVLEDGFEQLQGVDLITSQPGGQR